MSNLLTYFISERGSIVVLSFVGTFNRETVAMFPNLVAEMNARHPKMVIINCHDLKAIEPAAIAPFGEFQNCLRDLPSEVRLCFVRNELREPLLAQKAVRESELKNNLLDSVGSFPEHMKKKAA